MSETTTFEEGRDELRLDELARQAGVASTTVRLYQAKGLLHPPRLEGRVGWYDETHVARLRLIARLQQDGHSLAGIGDLLAQWERGRSLDAVIGVETQLDAFVNDVHAVDVDPVELLARFPSGAMTPALMRRAAALGLVTPGADGTVRIPDPRFVDTGAALAHLGVPPDVIVDEWETLTAQTDTIAERFSDLFDEYLAPTAWRDRPVDDQTSEVAATLAQLHGIARHVVAAALDSSLKRLARQQLGQILDEPGPRPRSTSETSPS